MKPTSLWPKRPLESALVGHAPNGRGWTIGRILWEQGDGMPSPQREPLRRLSRSERADLQRIVSSTSERIDHVRRAAALLAVARNGVLIMAAHQACMQIEASMDD